MRPHRHRSGRSTTLQLESKADIDQPLLTDRDFMSTRPSNKTELYRIAAGRKHNRYGGSCRFGSERTLRAGPSDHVHFALNKISDECGQTVVLALRPAVFDRHIVPLNVAGFTEPFNE